jgi:hypothetical protein
MTTKEQELAAIRKEAARVFTELIQLKPDAPTYKDLQERLAYWLEIIGLWIKHQP